MATVAIVGAGNIGGATAQGLASCDRVGRVLMIDTAVNAAAGMALDILQSGAISGFHTRLEATDDVSRLIGCSVCVFADRVSPNAGEWRGDEGLSMLTRMIAYLGDAPIVFAGASQAEMVTRAAHEAGIRRERLIGSSPEALVSAITAVVAMEAGCSPREITLTVLGIPPEGFVVPWSEASIGGYAMDRVLSQVQLARIGARAARLWPPGPYALGAAAARVAQAVLCSSRQSFSVLTQLGGEFGVRDRAGSLPVRLAARGIVQTRVPELNTRERVQLQAALGG